MADQEIYEKMNDYTLSIVTDFSRQGGADPELRRVFNFKARQVTNIFTQWSSGGPANSMVIQKFSELDSLEEVNDMHKKLWELGGRPPALETDAPGKSPARPPALRP